VVRAVDAAAATAQSRPQASAARAALSLFLQAREVVNRARLIARMKKPTSARRRSVSKRGAAPKTVDEYLACVPEPARSTLKKMRAAIRSAVPPDATEAISYRMPAFRHNGVLVWYAAFADHCSLFPTGSIVEAFKDELEGFKTSKGTIQFPADKPLPTALIKKLVKARVAQNEAKTRAK
jgi:uncharacterized protein YdhG (YjbR/CyaY superfamily)